MCPTSPSVQSSMMIQTGFSVMTPISFTMCGWSNWRMVTAETETARGSWWASLLFYPREMFHFSRGRVTWGIGNLTGLLEELLPDAVRCGVLTGLDGHGEGRVLLHDTQTKASDSLTHSLAVLLDGEKRTGKLQDLMECRWSTAAFSALQHYIPGSCTPPGGHLQTAPRRCSVPTQCGRAGSHSRVLNTQQTHEDINMHGRTHTHTQTSWQASRDTQVWNTQTKTQTKQPWVRNTCIMPSHFTPLVRV